MEAKKLSKCCDACPSENFFSAGCGALNNENRAKKKTTIYIRNSPPRDLSVSRVPPRRWPPARPSSPPGQLSQPPSPPPAAAFDWKWEVGSNRGKLDTVYCPRKTEGTFDPSIWNMQPVTRKNNWNNHSKSRPRVILQFRKPDSCTFSWSSWTAARIPCISWPTPTWRVSAESFRSRIPPASAFLCQPWVTIFFGTALWWFGKDTRATLPFPHEFWKQKNIQYHRFLILTLVSYCVYNSTDLWSSLT